MRCGSTSICDGIFNPSLPEPGLLIRGVKLNDHLSDLLDPLSLGVSNLEKAGREVVVDGDVQLYASLLHFWLNVLLVVRVNRGILEKGRSSVEIIVNALPEDTAIANSD